METTLAVNVFLAITGMKLQMAVLVSKDLRNSLRSDYRDEIGNVKESLTRLYSAHAREANRHLKLKLSCVEQHDLVENHVTRILR